MTDELKSFIESNIDLVDNGNFQELFDQCDFTYRAALYQTLLKADIDPLKHMTIILEGMFFENDELTQLIIPEGIGRIEGHAFSGCYNLTSITLPSTIQWIMEDAFEDCTNLSKITYQGTIEDWCYIVFEAKLDCDELYINGQLIKNLVIPSSVTRIRSGAFAGKHSIETLTVDQGVLEIGESAFDDCSNLRTVDLGNTVRSIEEFAFSDCIQLEEIFIPKSVQEINYGAFSGTRGVVINMEAQNADEMDYFSVEPTKVKKLNWGVTR